MNYNDYMKNQTRWEAMNNRNPDPNSPEARAATKNFVETMGRILPPPPEKDTDK